PITPPFPYTTLFRSIVSQHVPLTVDDPHFAARSHNAVFRFVARATFSRCLRYCFHDRVAVFGMDEFPKTAKVDAFLGATAEYPVDRKSTRLNSSHQI